MDHLIVCAMKPPKKRESIITHMNADMISKKTLMIAQVSFKIVEIIGMKYAVVTTNLK